MTIADHIHHEDDLDIHVRITERGPSRFTASIQVNRRGPDGPAPSVLIDRQELHGVECASAVTAESLALRAARKAAHGVLGRDDRIVHGIFGRSSPDGPGTRHGGVAFADPRA